MATKRVLENNVILGKTTNTTDNGSGLSPKAHYYRQGSTVEWYSPVNLVEAARTAMGSIDLDPATNEGNHTNAKAFYTKNTNGLDKDWNGNVWLNPPYGNGFAAWMHKVNSECASGRTNQIICLIPVRTNAGWFQSLGGLGISLCFPRSIKFIDGSTMLQSTTAAMMPNVIVYVGNKHREFAEAFREFGVVVRVSN
jgi:phage N-6-adenine-methyltransferase